MRKSHRSCAEGRAEEADRRSGPGRRGGAGGADHRGRAEGRAGGLRDRSGGLGAQAGRETKIDTETV